MVYKSGQIFLPFSQSTDGQTDGRTDGRTEFSSLERVCIPCSAVKTCWCHSITQQASTSDPKCLSPLRTPKTVNSRQRYVGHPPTSPFTSSLFPSLSIQHLHFIFAHFRRDVTELLSAAEARRMPVPPAQDIT